MTHCITLLSNIVQFRKRVRARKTFKKKLQEKFQE